MTTNTRAHVLPSPSEMFRELMAEPAPDELEIIKDQIEAHQRRSAALARLCDGIRELHTAPLRAQQGDLEAERLVSDTLRTLVLVLNPIDIDIIDRLRAHPDYFELQRISGDAMRRSYKVDNQIDKLNEMHASQQRSAAEAGKAKQPAKRSKYTIAYEAAVGLTAAQHRQLSDALLKS